MLANRIRQMENCMLCNYFSGMHIHLINSLTQLACLELAIIRFPRLVTYDNRMLISLSWILHYLESMLFCLAFVSVLQSSLTANLVQI